MSFILKDNFYKQLNVTPRDWELRSIFSDWLWDNNFTKEHQLQKWLIEKKITAEICTSGASKYYIYGTRYHSELYKHCILPIDIFRKLVDLNTDQLKKYSYKTIVEENWVWLYYRSLEESEQELLKCIEF